MVKQGKIRGEKVKYDDGIGYCIWYPFPKAEGSDAEEAGLCWDYADEDVADLMAVVALMKDMSPEREVPKEEAKPETQVSSTWLDFFRRALHTLAWKLLSI